MRNSDSSTCCNTTCDERSIAHSTLAIAVVSGLYRSNAPYCRGHRDSDIRRSPLAEWMDQIQPIAGRKADVVKRVLRTKPVGARNHNWGSAVKDVYYQIQSAIDTKIKCSAEGECDRQYNNPKYATS